MLGDRDGKRMSWRGRKVMVVLGVDVYFWWS